MVFTAVVITSDSGGAYELCYIEAFGASVLECFIPERHGCGLLSVRENPHL